MPDAAKASGFNVEKEINYIELLRYQKMIGADFGQGELKKAMANFQSQTAQKEKRLNAFPFGSVYFQCSHSSPQARLIRQYCRSHKSNSLERKIWIQKKFRIEKFFYSKNFL
jgi:hypothetical protein